MTAAASAPHDPRGGGRGTSEGWRGSKMPDEAVARRIKLEMA
eukprot:CAMPEP_0185486032 /NCGR_PEP_ID=MMETSP1366-20130426/10523_1 /TAXON_ID=38817 /ORGANISM="Gephyrocapsa oceanica, Strain RCC1303" /LENGTH=41 /DNA_ID= /DNA_START= /DNA_END= /DNA_ORIENTATION=